VIPRTIFYSWQSDTPSQFNRAFIEDALQLAIDRLHANVELVPALRDSKLELDSDTKGVSGSPPVTQTILNKIQASTAFVADLTFVAKSFEQLARDPARMCPNPNVLIEYGYALKCLDHERMIGVQNTAFGEPAHGSLPFDLRHLRWPITYHYEPANEHQRAAVLEKLASELTTQLQTILLQAPLMGENVQMFSPQLAQADPAMFAAEKEELVADSMFGGDIPEFIVPNEGRAYLRLYPSIQVPPLETELAARTIASRGALWPMGADARGCTPARNQFGAIVYDASHKNDLRNFTQLFLSKEIWGVDAWVLNATHWREHFPDIGRGYIPSPLVERTFVAALANYLQFAQRFLELPLPLRVRAGLTKIKGYPIAVDNGVSGRALHNNLEWTTSIDSFDLRAHEILKPFFERMWQHCGLERSEKFHKRLVEQFGTAA
jgi:hypothetical protein